MASRNAFLFGGAQVVLTLAVQYQQPASGQVDDRRAILRLAGETAQGRTRSCRRTRRAQACSSASHAGRLDGSIPAQRPGSTRTLALRQAEVGEPETAYRNLAFGREFTLRSRFK